MFMTPSRSRHDEGGAATQPASPEAEAPQVAKPKFRGVRDLFAGSKSPWDLLADMIAGRR